MNEKRTLVLGASLNPERYSFHAIKMLKEHEIPVFAVGLRPGEVFGVTIQRPFPKLENIDTISLYVGSRNQPFYYDFIIRLHPKRVIFNPGTENPDLEEILKCKGIEVVKACTLVMIINHEF